MKKAFSLFELTIVIVVISILATFIIKNSSSAIELSNETKIKSEIALIRSSISKQKTSNILLNENKSIVLDNESSEMSSSELFKNILDFPLISTDSNTKELAKWIKFSQNSYGIYINSEEFLTFSFEDNSFVCKSEISLCKEYE